MANADRCVCCGEIIPEGSHVCPNCKVAVNRETGIKDKLKPCPFCGGNARISADTEATRDLQGRLWAFTAVCDRCCATSGLTFSPDRAIKAWNRRA